MPANWYKTKIGFICDKANINELTRLYNSLRSISKTTCLEIPNSLNIPWLGCVALAHGIDYGTIPCTGEITEIGSYIVGGTSFVISTISAGNAAAKLWDEVLKQYTDIHYVYVTEEPCSGVYINTDTDGVCFNEKYILYIHNGDDPAEKLIPDCSKGLKDLISSKDSFTNITVVSE